MSGVMVSKKGSSPILIFLIIIVVIIPLGLMGIGHYEPVKLVVVQEKLLGLMKGGVSAPQEEATVEGCVRVKGRDGFWAVRRVTRTVRFRDGSELTTVYSEPPQKTSTQCP